MVSKDMWFEEVQDVHHDCHLEHQNRKILAILNFLFAMMPPITFQLIPTKASEGDGKCEKLTT